MNDNASPQPSSNSCVRQRQPDGCAQSLNILLLLILLVGSHIWAVQRERQRDVLPQHVEPLSLLRRVDAAPHTTERVVVVVLVPELRRESAREGGDGAEHRLPLELPPIGPLDPPPLPPVELPDWQKHASPSEHLLVHEVQGWPPLNAPVEAIRAILERGKLEKSR